MWATSIVSRNCVDHGPTCVREEVAHESVGDITDAQSTPAAGLSTRFTLTGGAVDQVMGDLRTMVQVMEQIKLPGSWHSCLWPDGTPTRPTGKPVCQVVQGLLCCYYYDDMQLVQS